MASTSQPIALFLMILTDGPAGIAQTNHTFGHILGDNTAGTDDRVRTDMNTRHHEDPRANEGMGTDRYFCRYQRQRCMIKVMGSRAKIDLLSDCCMLSNFNFSETVGIGTITQT
jgi:hypothetical protein